MNGKLKMKKLIIILIVLFAAGCGNELPIKDNYVDGFEQAKKSIRKFAESHFDTSIYHLGEGSVGCLDKFEPPIKIVNFLGADTAMEKYKMIHYEQRHLGVPIHCDSTYSSYWTYYQLDENFLVLSYSNASIQIKE